MKANLVGALEQINKSYKLFEHRGQRMSKEDVRKILNYGLSKGYKTSDELTESEVDTVLNIHICYKTNELCKYNCKGLCRESF